MRARFAFVFLTLIQLSNAQIPAGYYNTATGTGEELWQALHEIIRNPTTENYSDVDEKFIELGTDQDPNNSNNIILFYMRQSRPSSSFTGNGDGNDNTGGWNKEHVWPRSRGVGDSGDDQQDMHMLRPTDVDVNSRRGNLDFGLVSGNNTANGSYFEPHDDVKGDCARILFYMVTCYKGSLFLVENVTNSSNQLGNLTLLMSWHEQDPVDDFERDRNNKVASYQGNRNPFVDHPEWVNAIWGDGSTNHTPTISTTATQGGYNLGNVVAGQSSNARNYKVTGTNLEGNVNVSTSAPFQVSLNNSTWSTSVVIMEANAEANTNNTVYVRFSPTVANGQTYNGSISHSSANASNTNVAVTGKEGVAQGGGQITLVTTSFISDFGQVALNSTSASSTYQVSATGLSSNLDISAPEHFLISQLPTSGYGSAISLVPSSGSISNKTIYVVFKPGSEGNLNGEIVHASGSANQALAVSGYGGITTSSVMKNTEIQIYPNPTEGFVSIEGVDWKTTTVRIFDNNGYRLPVRLVEGRIDVSEFPKGMYYFTFSGNGNPVVHKVVLK